MRHDCKAQGWSHCCICNGRIHEDGCTTKRNRFLDCCPERHKMLYDAGHLLGIGDESFFMWTPEHPYGVHRGDLK